MVQEGQEHIGRLIGIQLLDALVPQIVLRPGRAQACLVEDEIEPGRGEIARVGVRRRLRNAGVQRVVDLRVEAVGRRPATEHHAGVGEPGVDLVPARTPGEDLDTDLLHRCRERHGEVATHRVLRVVENGNDAWSAPRVRTPSAPTRHPASSSVAAAAPGSKANCAPASYTAVPYTEATGVLAGSRRR